MSTVRGLADGSKPIGEGLWFGTIVDRGEPYFGHDSEDLRKVFLNIRSLWEIGCASALNAPVRWGGRTLGSFNIRGSEGRFGEREAKTSGVDTQLAVPLFVAGAQPEGA